MHGCLSIFIDSSTYALSDARLSVLQYYIHTRASCLTHTKIQQRSNANSDEAGAVHPSEESEGELIFVAMGPSRCMYIFSAVPCPLYHVDGLDLTINESSQNPLLFYLCTVHPSRMWLALAEGHRILLPLSFDCPVPITNIQRSLERPKCKKHTRMLYCALCFGVVLSFIDK